MKTTASFLAILFLCFSTAFAAKEDNILDGPPQLERDKQIGLSGRVVQDAAYFKLIMLNESKDGIYTLIKEYENGEKETLGMRHINANTIDSPLMYSFVERELPEEDVSYVLYRVTDETVVVRTWKYCSDEAAFCNNGLIAYQ